ncbi:MAG: VWA domain-containing protein, partial [Myxococcota bacterium]
LVGASEYTTAVDVDFVEIHASIVDRRGRTIEDVRPEEVVLEEAGERQEIKRFELLRDLPIHAAVMIDTSSSMAEELDEAERAALRFFGEVLTDRDRAAVVTFAEEPRLAVRFTRSLEVLAGGLAGLEAYGETKIWDALAFTLHYFSGLRGKRALVLLTDGVDSSSRYPFADVLEYAKRTGVAIYTVGLNVPRYPPDAGMYLDQLAHQTGGRTYRIDRAVALGPIYETIERELRSQYLIAYQSSHADGVEFRPLELDVERPGAQVSTVAGYYP